MNAADTPFVAFDPEDVAREQARLAGHTVEDLNDYLDRDRTPADPTIDDSPECALALAGLERLRTALRSADRAAVDRESGRQDDGWVSSIIDNIRLEAHAGRRIPLAPTAPTADLALSEGAVLGILRAAGDGLDGILVSRCRLVGDVTVPGAPITVHLEAAVLQGEPIPALAERLRAAVYAALREHTELTIDAVDITVNELYPRPAGDRSTETENETTRKRTPDE